MIKLYSKNVRVGTGESIPLNNLDLLLGCSVEQQSASSSIFNKCGVYRVDVSGYAVAESAGDITVQLQKNGVNQPSGVTSATAANTTDNNAFAFTDLVQVPQNNTGCPCVIPTTIQLVNTGVDATFNITVVITRV